MGAVAFQDLMVHNQCWGCGPSNEHGLRVKSRWSDDGEESVCRWAAEPHLCAGSPEVLNGGVIAALLDCHAVCTAAADAYRLAGREIGTEPRLGYVTASINVQYRRPTPVAEPVTVWARVVERSGRRTTLACRLESHGRECARAEVVAVRPMQASEDDR
jgi:acyl-coenzyme A thioesterase PaaI-like protein